MGQSNPISHYGGPLIAVVLGWATIFGLVLALVGNSISNWLMVLYPHWVAITYLVWLAMDFRTNAFSSPPVRSVRLDEGLLIVGHRDWLGISVAVLIYKQDGEFERLICAGEVINVQKNGLVQIALRSSGLDETEIANVRAKLSDGENGTLIIKPGQAQES